MIAARPTTSSARRYTETLVCEPASARRARLLVSAAMNAWGISEMSAAGVQIVTELVSNAVEHTRCRSVRVLVTRTTDHRVRIAVADTCRDTPEMDRPGGDAEGGRGLFLVDALSSRWGYDRNPWGKVVWAELEMPATSEHQFAEAVSLAARTSRPGSDDALPGSAPRPGSHAPCSPTAAPSASRPPRCGSPPTSKLPGPAARGKCGSHRRPGRHRRPRLTEDLIAPWPCEGVLLQWAMAV